MKNIAVFASGNGTNFEAIINAVESKELDCNVAILVCNKKNAYAIERAKNHGIDTLVLSPKKFESKYAYESEILKELKKREVSLIALAGYMPFIGECLLENYPNKIINIHPSLLPAFKGSPHAIEDAYNYGVKVFGVTTHYVTLDIDGGKIIKQRAFEYNGSDDLEAVEEKIHAIEHILYVETLKEIL